MNLLKLMNLEHCFPRTYACETYEFVTLGGIVGLIIVTCCFILAIGTYFTLKKLGKIK